MTSWNLFREMDQLHREMNSLFKSVGSYENQEFSFLPGIGTRRYPRLNLREDENNFYLAALLPGVDAKKLDITVVGNTLTLSGERTTPVAEEGKTWHRNERGHGKVLRSVDLPGEVDSGKVSAEYINGVLQVTLPKAEAAKPKQIAVKVR